MDLDLPPVVVTLPVPQTVPLVFASPHSGRDYPASFIASARLDPLRLRRSEDSFVDELFAAAPLSGAALVSATFPRAFCDANREAWELDPTMFEEKLPAWVNTSSARVGAGLGTIARVVSTGESIYRGKLRFVEAQARVKTYWQPFHDALRARIDGTQALFGGCLLLDCHSMPQGALPAHVVADFVLGDVHGTTCAPELIQLVQKTLTDQGFRVRRNDPYAGGYITRHYGRPREGVQALQIEISRSLYMDELRIERLAGFSRFQDHMTALIELLAEAALSLV